MVESTNVSLYSIVILEMNITAIPIHTAAIRVCMSDTGRLWWD
jgi:hypothetical protein